MTHVLTLESGEKYTVSNGQSETHSRLQNDGQIVIEGSLTLDGEPPETGLPNDSTAIDIPMAIESLSMVTTGTAVFIGMVLALLLAAGLILRNYLVIIMWSVSFSMLIITSLFSLGLEYFWLAIILTIFMTIVGVAGRLYVMYQKSRS